MLFTSSCRTNYTCFLFGYLFSITVCYADHAEMKEVNRKFDVLFKRMKLFEEKNEKLMAENIKQDAEHIKKDEEIKALKERVKILEGLLETIADTTIATVEENITETDTLIEKRRESTKASNKCGKIITRPTDKRLKLANENTLT